MTDPGARSPNRPLVVLAMLAAGTWAPAGAAEDVEADPVPLVGRLEVITLGSQGLDELSLFYGEGLGLTLEGPISLPEGQQSTQRRLWQIGEGLEWQEYRLSRPVLFGSTRLRILLFDRTTAAQQPDWRADRPGASVLVFPVERSEDLEERMRRLGFGAGPRSGSKRPRADGSRYSVQEQAFFGPDFVTVTGVAWIGTDPMARVDPESGLGAPVRISRRVVDLAAARRFYTEVLDLEVREDTTRAAEASTPQEASGCGQLLLAARRESAAALALVGCPGGAPDAPASGSRHRGLVGLAFLGQDLGRLEARARALGTTVLGREEMVMPMLGVRRVLALRAPDGLLIEVIEEG